MTGVDKLELPQFSIVDIRLVSREVRFTTGEADEMFKCSHRYSRIKLVQSKNKALLSCTLLLCTLRTETIVCMLIMKVVCTI